MVKMYRALYEYNSTLPGYLSFRAGDQFTVINRVNKDWLQAQNGLGQLGYVPCSYVQQVQANAEEVLKFVDWSIEAIHLQATSENAGQYSHQQRATLKTLVKHREDVMKELQARAPLERSQSEDIVAHKSRSQSNDRGRRQSERRRAPPPPPVSDAKAVQQTLPKQASSSSPPPPSPPPASICEEKSTLVTEVLPSAPGDTLAQEIKLDENDSKRNGELSNHFEPTSERQKPPIPINTPSPDQPESDMKSLSSPTDEKSAIISSVQLLLKDFEVPEKIGSELLEEVRKSTGLSFEKSKIAVETVLGYVGFKLPVLEGLVDKMLNSLHFGRDISDEDVTSYDAQRLDVIFSELTACKDDSQQRSWALHEDEAIIQEYLQELLSILENAKPSICRKVVARDNYDILHSLVQYYQMETRPGLCRLLLKVFGALCGLEKQVILQLLYSVLPLELGQELAVHSDDAQRICYVALVLTMIFSTGDNVSTAVTDQLNESFFLHIIQQIENLTSPQFEDDAVDLLISFILAFNLHLTAVDTNVVLQALAALGNPKIFTERIMVLLNRGDDPVRILEFQPQPPNSVLKLFQDLYSDLTTSDLLYTNDARVLMDIIISRLLNLSPGDKIRSSFLSLCQKVVQNSSYPEHRHRVRELRQCLEAISSEEIDLPEDKEIALTILSSNRDIFSDESN